MFDVRAMAPKDNPQVKSGKYTTSRPLLVALKAAIKEHITRISNAISQLHKYTDNWFMGIKLTNKNKNNIRASCHQIFMVSSNQMLTKFVLNFIP